MIYCQLISDTPKILNEPFDCKSAKVEEFIRLMSDELLEEKVIVYSKFEKCVSYLQGELKKERIPSLRITGKEGAEARETAKKLFQEAEVLKKEKEPEYSYLYTKWGFGSVIYC